MGSIMQNSGLQRLLTDWHQTETRSSILAEAYTQAPFGEDYDLKADLAALAAQRLALLSAISEHPIAGPEDAAAKLEIVALDCSDDHKPAIASVITFLRRIAPLLMMATTLDPILYRGLKIAGVALSNVFSIA